MSVRGLDDPCGTCRRRSGDHTLDQWAVCLGTPALDLAYEDVPGGPIPLSVDGRQVQWADHVTVRSCVVGGEGSGIGVVLPAAIFTFQLGSTVGPPFDVAEVALVGSPETMRTVGRLVRDSCNGAANAAERAG